MDEGNSPPSKPAGAAILWVRFRDKLLSTPIRREFVLAGALTAVVLVVMPNGPGAGSAIASGPGYVDPNAVFDARSPGARPHGALYQTKPDRVAAADRGPRPAGPEQRVLSTVRDRPMVIPVNDVAPSVPLLDPTAVDPLTRSAFAPNFDPVIPSPSAEPFGVMRGPTATGPVNAVPEPDAWLMLIGGHAVLGWSLRRRRRLQPAP